MSNRLTKWGLVSLLGLAGIFLALPIAYAQDSIMGQVQFHQSSDAGRTSGVWVDGQYVGYVGELAGHNRLRLLPGSHEIMVRQAGYEDFNRRVIIEPGKVLDVQVGMERDTRFQYPNSKTAALVRLNVNPDRAAVFLDNNFVGHVNEFYGAGRGMLVAPGKHNIKIDLGGYKTFETEITLLPKQKFVLKTALMAGSITDADPLIKPDRNPAERANTSEANADDQAK